MFGLVSSLKGSRKYGTHRPFVLFFFAVVGAGVLKMHFPWWRDPVDGGVTTRQGRSLLSFPFSGGRRLPPSDVEVDHWIWAPWDTGVLPHRRGLVRLIRASAAGLGSRPAIHQMHPTSPTVARATLPSTTWPTPPGPPVPGGWHAREASEELAWNDTGQTGKTAQNNGGPPCAWRPRFCFRSLSFSLFSFILGTVLVAWDEHHLMNGKEM